MATRKTARSSPKEKKVSRPSSAKKTGARTSAKKTSTSGSTPKGKIPSGTRPKTPAPTKATAAPPKTIPSTPQPGGEGRGTRATSRKGVRRPLRVPQVDSADPSSAVWIIDGIEIVDPSKPMPKTKLGAKQLREFRELLLAKRRELLGDMHQLSSEALHSNRQESSGDLSNMPSHMADVGSDNWEQELTLGLIATEHALLRQIDAALKRMENGTYGVCQATHRMISSERLRAKPWAQHCIEFARLRDAGRIPPGLV